MDQNHVTHSENMYFTSLPRYGDAKLVHHIYKEKLKESLLSLIKSANIAFKNDTWSELGDKIEQLRTQQRFSPSLYYLHHSLLVAMQKNDALLAEKILRKIESLHKTGICNENLLINYGIKRDYEQFIAREAEKIKVKNIRGELPKINKKFSLNLKKYEAMIFDSINFIQNHDPVMSEQIKEYVSSITLFEGQGAMGMTDVRGFGSILLRVPEKWHDPLAYFSEHLIHETSHLHLHALMSTDPLILNSPEEKYNAPIRLDQRPMFGVFHATFVLSRIVRFFRYIVAVKPNNPKFSETLNTVEKQFANGCNTVFQYARCSESGMRIMNSFQETAQSLLKTA